ncbi:YheC/YheD family protein [Paenibacillus yonginensis]|uniref:YheC/YheD family endospore coat-associated protein n=1 Tax=Paenibacillus yonginensis TaxID=1462996 RepID=UPI000A979F8C|nr:YheC/YheD family protein [Paenibacillus yonginensis]
MSITSQDDRKPVIAVLTVADPARKFAGNHANFRDILKTGKELGYQVYVLTTRDLKLAAGQVQGYTYQAEGKQWIQQWFPLPDIIYNRIPNREEEKKGVIQRKISACLNHPQIQLFNPFFFNKWKLFGWLRKSKQTSGFVPATKRLSTRSSLANMLAECPQLYLKPESGKAGKGIMKLTYDSQDKKPYKLIVQAPNRNVVYKTGKFPLLWRRIRLETDKTPYIMQQEIKLASYQGRRFDLRVLVQKTSRGFWSVTGIGARLAGRRRITTHVPQGGSVENPREMLLPTFGSEKTDELLELTRTSAIVIARQIEKGCGHPLGEMSMDLGVDADGKLWFFEANSKPMKFDEPQIRQKSLQRLFHYSSYLSKSKKG